MRHSTVGQTFPIVAILVLLGFSQDLAAQCDSGEVGTRTQSCEATCSGTDPNQLITCEQVSQVRSVVSCSDSSWKIGNGAWASFPINGRAQCGAAAEGTSPICQPTYTVAIYWGISGSNVVFKQSAEDASVSGVGCSWASPETLSYNIATQGCCATACQDEVACENEAGRIYDGNDDCRCKEFSSQCDQPESCIHPGPNCDVETWYDPDCGCCKADGSPIIIDLSNSSLRFVSEFEGILFDIFDNGRPVRVSWPSNDETAAYWLALDRDGNGRIDDGGELFGNATRLASGTKAPHGYAALAEFDSNRDGLIDGSDPVYDRLVLWRRPLPAGAVQLADEIRPLRGSVTAISLDIQELPRRDRWGNTFRYRSRVTLASGESRWSYDVFLQHERTSASEAPPSRRQ